MKRSRWDMPVFSEGIKETYVEVYGTDSGEMVRVMESSPEEVAVISTLAAYLNKALLKKEG